jgi:hypothetical protein
MNNLRKIIKETLESHINKPLILKEDIEVSPSLSYHINESLSLTNNLYSEYSEPYFNLVNEVRHLWNEGKIDLNDEDRVMVESDLGLKVKKGNEIVYLDAPYICENSKKFAVYVKTLNEGIKKITFDEPKSNIKNSNKCDQMKDKTTSRYWSCSVGRYSKQLGL